MAATVSLPDEREWLKRPYDERIDDGLYYLLSVSYTRSRAGWRAGASRAGRTMKNREPCPPEEVDRQVAFMEAHRHIWEWLLANAEVTLAVDRTAPEIVWGWLITSGPDVVHALGVKRTVVSVDRALAQEIAKDLAGERWGTWQQMTLELPQLQRETQKFRGSDLLGIIVPPKWNYHPSWLATHLPRPKVAA